MATYPIKMLRDENDNPFVPLVSTECIKDPGGQSLDQKLATKLETSDIVAGNNISVSTSGNEVTISASLPPSGTLIDNLTTSTANQGALDAHQGYVLKGMIPAIVDDLTSTDATKALSAKQGYVLNQKFNDYTLTSALEDLIKQYILASHPIGSIEINVSGANPSTYLGGTWIAWGSGKVPVGINTSDADFATVEKTGGNKTHTHGIGHTHGVPGVAHTHTTGNHTLTIAEIPNHNHDYQAYIINPNGNWPGGYDKVVVYGQPAGTAYNTFSTAATGGSGAHNHGNTGSTTPNSTTTNSQSTSTSGSSSNLQPYITCYMWKRTA